MFSILPEIQTLSFNLFLTGSRFFGNVHDESDWDFYCGSLIPEQEQELKLLGFTQEDKDSSILFGGVVKVFKHSTKDIHILVVHDLDRRHLAQKVVKEFFPSGYANKIDNAKSVWDMAELIANMRLSMGEKP
jgi:hypothetical protein